MTTSVSITNFAWTIQDFDMCPQPPDQAIESPCFSVDSAKRTKFSLFLYPRGRVKDTTADEMFVSLYLKRHCDEAEEEIKLLCAVSLVDKSNLLRNYKAANAIFKKGSLVGYVDFIERNDLVGEERCPYFSENVLTVFSTISGSAEEEIVKLQWGDGFYEDLSSNFDTLLESGSHSDMCIKMAAEEFKVHRVILEGRCPSLMKQLVRLKIPNTYSLRFGDSAIFQKFLNCLYTGELYDNFPEEMLSVLNEFPVIKESLFPVSCNIAVTTEIRVSRVTYPWFLTKYDDLKVDEYFCKLLSGRVSSWSQMAVSLTKIREKRRKNTFALEFKRLSVKEIMFMRFKIQCSNESHEIWVKESEHVFENEYVWTTHIYIRRNKDKSHLDKDKSHLDGALHLLVNISLSVCDPNAVQSRSTEDSIIDVYDVAWVERELKKSFQRDLYCLRRDTKNADLTLKVDGEEILAHKAILSCRSPVFSKMFEHDMKEKRTGVVDIVDIDQTTMASFLTFLYCGDLDVPLSVSSAVKLYRAADKYEVKFLIKKCHVYLKENVNADTVCEILLLAATCDDLSLRDKCCDFIQSHPNEIANGELYFDALERLCVGSDVFNKLSRRTKRYKEKPLALPKH